jgi:Tol biopolymer transport system component
VALDERLKTELERAGRPADPSGVYEDLIRRRERRRLVRKAEIGALGIIVVLGSIGGFLALTRIFGGSDAPEVAAAPLSNGEIVFSIALEGEGEALMAVTSDGTRLRRLTPEGIADYRSPDVSPDGRTVVVVHSIPSFEGEQEAVLATVPIEGGSPTWLTDEPAIVEDPTWSPDGTSIAFIGEIPGEPFGLYVLDLDAGDARLIAGTENMLTGEPTWSPDGERLAFEGSTGEYLGPGATNDAWDIYVARLDGSEPKNVTRTPDESEVWPAWSWETNRIAFVRSVPRGSGIYTMAPDGSDRRLVFGALSNLGGPAWSPDGTMIAFSADTGQIYTVPAAGGDLTAVPGALGEEPAWQAVPRTETIAPTSTPSTEADPSPTGEDIGLGFPVCDVTSVEGRFAPDVDGRAFVATRTGDTGTCPTDDGGLQVLAVDVTGDGLADASYGPLECDWFCSAFSAPDVNGDDIDEVLIQNVQFSIAGLQMFVIGNDADAPTVEPVTIAPPGDPEGELEPGAIAQLWLGGDAFALSTLRCGTLDAPDGPGIIFTEAESLPHDSPDAEWHAHEVTLALRDGELHVVDVRDFTEPAGSDAPSFQSGQTLCGSNLGPSQLP